MMHLNLRAHPDSIAGAVIRHADPLRVFRVLNHVRSWSECEIGITKPGEETTRIALSFRNHHTNSLEIAPCLDGVVPEVFDCDMLEFDDQEYVHRLLKPRSALDKSHNSLLLPLTSEKKDESPEEARLTLVNYSQPFILPEFSLVDRIVSRLHADTLMQCGSAKLGSRSVTVRVLADKARTIKRMGFNRSRVQSLKSTNTPFQAYAEQLEEAETMVDLLLWAGANARKESRIQIYAGAVPVWIVPPAIDQTLIGPLNVPLMGPAKAYLGCSLEIAVPEGVLGYDLDHSIVPDHNYKDVLKGVQEWVRSLAGARKIDSLRDAVKGCWEEDVANRLQARQIQLRRTPMVFLRGEAILQEPRSEKDVIALYFKLEGAGALPVQSCCVLEHTPARGTDAIGHFRISAGDAPNQYALIEFEHDSVNFRAHGHSARHVDLIICWSASDSERFHSTEHEWLMSYSATELKKTIPILILSRIPELEVRSV